MTIPTTSSVDEPTTAHAQLPTLLWAVKRTLLAVVILGLFIGMAAWLFYVSVEQDPGRAGAGNTEPPAAFGRS